MFSLSFLINTKKSVHVRIQTTPSIIYFRSIIYAGCSHILAQYFGFISSLLFIQHIFILQQHIHIMIFSPCFLFFISYYSDMIIVNTFFTITLYKYNLYRLEYTSTFNNYISITICVHSSLFIQNFDTIWSQANGIV